MRNKNNQKLTWGGYFSQLNTKALYLGVLAFISLLLLTAYVSYAVFSVKEEKSGTLNIVTGTLYPYMESIELDSNNQITVNVGETKSFEVLLKNINSRSVKTNFYYQWISSNPGNIEIGYSTTSQDIPPTTEGYVLGINSSKTITIGIKNKSNSNITLKFGSNIGMEKPPLTFPNNSYAITKTIQLEYQDNSGANIPELVEGLIPVVYDGTNWVSVDYSTPWYNYIEQWWANAVTTTETNRAKYKLSGTVIPMSDINTMWVWVPRYEYQFSNMATAYAGGTAALPGPISINFLNKDINTSSDPTNYIVHPAFTFGDQELGGIWVGKFETGNQTACTATNNVANSACDLTALGVQIKPNVSSWRGIRVSTAFMVSREMSNASNIYGLNNSTTDSHMMKNTEWGAVAYLTQSIYGKYGNANFEGKNKEVYLNNYTLNRIKGALTGCSAGVPSREFESYCAYTYEKENTGVGASTTGNIYGVYDMSGGAEEYVMGNMKNSDNSEQQSGKGNNYNYNSGFNGVNYDKTIVVGDRSYPDNKYYDSYNHGTSYTDHSSRYIKGDATYEVSQGDGKYRGWYSDYNQFVYTDDAWFLRSGIMDSMTGISAGIFGFNYASGYANENYSFRLVLSKVS